MVCMVLSLQLIPLSPLTSPLKLQQSHERRYLGVCTTNQPLTGMHFQTDDEEPGSSESTAERGEREEMLKHFVPVNMLTERTVERMKKMEGRRRRGLVVHYCNECNYATHEKPNLVKHSRTHSGEKPFHCEFCDQKVRKVPSKSI